MWRVHPRGNNWSVGATWKPSLKDSVSNRVFSKNKGNVNASHSRTVLRHSLSLTLPLTPPFSTLCHSPSHASVTPSHAESCLTTLTPLMLIPFSLWWLSHSPSPLSINLVVSSTVSTRQSVLSSMILLLCDFFTWVCGFCSKVIGFVCYSVWFDCTFILQKRMCDHGATIQSSL